MQRVAQSDSKPEARKHPLRLHAAAAMLVILGCVSSAQAATWQAPLSPELRSHAAALALDALGSDAPTNLPAASTANSTLRPRNASGSGGSPDADAAGDQSDSLLHSGSVALVVERRERKRGSQDEQPQDLIDAFVYHYAAGTLHRVTVAAGSDAQPQTDAQSVIEIRQLHSIQLPLTPSETRKVLQHLQQHAVLQQALASEYQQFHHRSLNSDQLDYRVAVWNPQASMPVPTSETPLTQSDTGIEPASSAARTRCAERRCALIAVFTRDMFNFSIEPVIDLATGEVWLDALADPRLPR